MALATWPLGTKDQFNFVTLTNTTNKDLKLAKGRAVATFLRDDLEAYDTMLGSRRIRTLNQPTLH